MRPLGGIAEADALLGRPCPLPTAALPLVRWVEVFARGEGVEVVWNLDDSRDGAPGRLALYAGLAAPPDQLPAGGPAATDQEGFAVRGVPLPEAQPSLRPVLELRWRAGDLHLRLTGQGPWAPGELVAIARGIEPLG